MTKLLFLKNTLLLATFAVAGQSMASANDIKRDSSNIFMPKIENEWLAELEPTYTNDVVVGSPWSRNWFVSISAGAEAFAGSPIGCEDLFGRMQPALQVAAGKWFTPSIGARVAYQGFGIKFTDAAITDHRYHNIHADLLWNIIGMNHKDELGLHRWTVAPYVGLGVICHGDNDKTPFAFDYGVMGAYRLNRQVSVNVEFSGMNTFQDFDGYGKKHRFGDQMFSLTAGLTFNIGKVGWKRAVDAVPYRQQNERMNEIISEMLQEREGGNVDSSLVFKNNMGGNGEYSGLASLRARMANKDWNGKEPVPNGGLAGQSGDEARLIGVPYYFFFKINTCDLTDQSQLQNLTNLAKVAKMYNLNVYVEGAADAATGTEAINTSLSQARATYIAGLLHDYGVADEMIHIRANGGIDKFSPIERNRHTRVMIKE